jgi:hypothetical protein
MKISSKVFDNGTRCAIGKSRKEQSNMANRNTMARNAHLRKEKKHFHGQACDTGFGAPGNKRKSAHDYDSVKKRAGSK